MAAGQGQHYRPPQSLSSELSRIVRGAAGLIAERLGAFAAAQAPVAVPGIGNRFGIPWQKPRDPQQEAILRSRNALGGRTTYYAGQIPAWLSTYQGGLTAARIKAIQNEVLVTGLMFNKASLDEEILLIDAHLRAVDDARRVAVTGKPFTVEPFDETDLAQQVADYLTAVVGQIDGYQESCKRLLFCNAAGYAVEEGVFADTPCVLRCRAGDREIEVEAHHPLQRQWVSNKITEWVIDREELRLSLGNGKTAELPPWKFVIHEAPGDFQIRRRGYMYAAQPLHLIKWNAIARWGVLLDIWGIPVPYGVVDYDLWQDERRRREYEAILRDFGLGKPALFTDDLQVTASPTISDGDARGMHAALIGWINTEYSKLVQGQTLTTELGGVGSYNASETHAEVKETIVQMDERALSNTERRWYKHVLWIACHEFNEDGSIRRIAPRGLSAQLGVTPEQVLQKCGVPYWRIQREVTPQVRMDLMDRAINSLGLDVDAEQAYKEFGLQKARTKDKRIPGKPQVLSTDERLASSLTEPPPEQGADKELPHLELTATDIGTIVTVNEARRAKGMEPIEGGDISIAEYKVKLFGTDMPGQPSGVPAEGAV